MPRVLPPAHWQLYLCRATTQYTPSKCREVSTMPPENLPDCVYIRPCLALQSDPTPAQLPSESPCTSASGTPGLCQQRFPRSSAISGPRSGPTDQTATTGFREPGCSHHCRAFSGLRGIGVWRSRLMPCTQLTGALASASTAELLWDSATAASVCCGEWRVGVLPLRTTVCTQLNTTVIANTYVTTP